MNDEQQQSSQQVRDSLIALYIWAEVNWDNALGKAINRVSNLFQAYQLDETVRFLQRAAYRIVNILDARTPVLLDGLEQCIAAEAATAVQVEHVPPKPPTHTGLDRPGEPSEPPFDFTVRLGRRATDAIHTDLQTELMDVRKRILRQPNDLYKLTASGAATHDVLKQGDTIGDAQQRMLTDLLRHGITGFTDSAGRHWQLSTYVEMAVRTAVMRATNEAHLTVMQAAGITLYTIPTHVHTCPKCHEWQGRILSVTPDSRADATLDEARKGGLWHPNCEHTIIAWHEGDARHETKPWSDNDQRLWKASQRQRSLEAGIRTQKRLAESTPSMQMRNTAKQRIRRYQSELRELTDETGLLRRCNRERLNLGLGTS